MSSNTITVDEYVTIAIAEINKFGDEWKKNQAENPEMYPERLTEGDWGEQELGVRFGLSP